LGKVQLSVTPELPFKTEKLLNPLQVLLLIKYLRPDALHEYLRTFVAEAKSSAYFYVPHTNLETAARTFWFRRPTVLFHGPRLDSDLVSSRLQAAAVRNDKTLTRVSFAGSPAMNEACMAAVRRLGSKADQWVLIEDFHLVRRKAASLVVKWVNALLQEDVDPGFKVWLSFQVRDDAAGGGTLKPHLKPLFQDFHRSYVTPPRTIKERLLSYYALEKVQNMNALEERYKKLYLTGNSQFDTFD
jgi:hypothetical protein